MADFTNNGGPKKADIVVDRDTLKRLVKDARDLRKNPLDVEGIYYIHDETNVMKGYAMIVGPKDSVYYGGYYFFYIDFPADYPYSPPKLTYATNDGVTRFHPNLYKNGKVCLSILNTWRGEAWSSCQTIRSILITVLSVLDSKPLLNEPGFTEKSADFNNYNQVITYKNVEFSILRAISKNAGKYFPPILLKLFDEQIRETFDKNKNDIYETIKIHESKEDQNYFISCYRMTQTISWKKVCEIFKKECEDI